MICVCVCGFVRMLTSKPHIEIVLILVWSLTLFLKGHVEACLFKIAINLQSNVRQVTVMVDLNIFKKNNELTKR